MVRQFRTISLGDLRSSIMPNVHLMDRKPLPINDLGYWSSVAFRIDHVHLLIDIHPALDLSVLINNLKTASARRARTRFAQHLAPFYWKPMF